MKLIPEARNWWRMATVRLALVVGIFGSMPADMQQAVLELLPIPEGRIPAVLALVFITLRLIKQPSVSATKKLRDAAFDQEDGK